MSYLDAALKVKTTSPEAGKVAPIRPDQAKTRPRPSLDAEDDPVVPFGSDPRYHYWAGGQSLGATIKEFWEERAAIREYEGRQTREEAERGAWEDVQRMQAKPDLPGGPRTDDSGAGKGKDRGEKC